MSATLIRQSRRCHATGTTVTVYDLDAEGAPLDRHCGEGVPSDPRWLTACEDHGTNVGHDTLQLARWHASQPDGWCEQCRLIVAGVPTAKCSACGGFCLWHDEAWVCDECGDEWFPDHGPQYAVPGV